MWGYQVTAADMFAGVTMPKECIQFSFICEQGS